MGGNFDVNQFKANFEPYKPLTISQPNQTFTQENPRGNINWWKYLRWSLSCLALVIFSIYITPILQRFRAQWHQDCVDIGTDTSNEPLNERDVTECLWIISSASSINSFPLLLSVNEPLHRGVLDELFAGTLDKLAQTQTEVSLTLINRAQILTKHLAQAAKVFTHSEYNTVAFQTDINSACEQLKEMDSLLNSLAKIYYGVKGTYDTVNATMASALEEVRLTNQTEYRSNAQSWGRAWFWDTYWHPWDKMSKKMEKVRLGFSALESEVTRLEQIKQVIHWLKNNLQDLSASIHGWHTECTLEAQHNCFPRKVREWFQQNFVHNYQLKMTWVELLASVDRGEQKIYLDISHEWCNRSRQAVIAIDSG